MKLDFNEIKVEEFVNSCLDKNSYAYSSIPNGEISLYATCYAILTKLYLSKEQEYLEESLQFIRNSQDEATGYFIGPEIKDFYPKETSRHDREHILRHSTITAIPVLQQYNVALKYPLWNEHKYCEVNYLQSWLDARNWTNSWLEGNNLLFTGQILIYLRDFEKVDGADESLALFFNWLDQHVDPKTGMWGTDGFCSPFIAMCGAYHQLLVYYHENRPVLYPERIVDTILSLQHYDGGFFPGGGGGACEDVDAIDILVNMYKRYDYKRSTIRVALRRALKHLIVLQNEDGGFPYRANSAFSHMGIPATYSGTGKSNMFSTWFRTHTIALISEILVDEINLENGFVFNKYLSMGWHQKWNKSSLTKKEKADEIVSSFIFGIHLCIQGIKIYAKRVKSKCRSMIRL